MRNFNLAQRWMGHVVILTAALAIASGCANKAGETNGTATQETAPAGAIVIGEYGSMTGPQATFGVSTDNGIKLAVDQADKAGGMDGHQFWVKLYDDESKPDTTQVVANRLASQDHPTAVLGEVASGRSQIAAPIFNTNKIPMITPSSTNPKVTQVGPYIFRVCFLDQFQGYAAAKFCIDTLKITKAAIFTDSVNQYSIGLGGFFKENFTKMGGTIVAEKDYTATDQDFHSALTEIASAHPQVLYVPGYYDSIGTIAKQARQVGLTVPLMGGDGWDSPKLVEGAGGPGGALEGSYFTNHYSVSDPAPAVQAFVAAYKAQYGAVPDALAALGYDAANLLIQAMKTVPKPADGNYASDAYRAQLRDAIAKVKDFPGITGKITIGPDRNAVKSAVVLQIKGANYIPAATIVPPK